MFGLTRGKPIFVYGLGGSGRAVADKLSEAGFDLWVYDDKPESIPAEIRGRSGVSVVAVDLQEGDCGVDWHRVQALVKTPGISGEKPLVQAAVRAGVPVLGEVDLFWRREKDSRAVILGITGTNGKSTTTALVAHILQSAGHVVAAGGNLGTPLLYLPDLEPGGFYVIELSSYQLDMMRELQVDGGIFLNLTPDHLARHHTMEAYRDVKLKMFVLAKPDAVKVMGVDQPILRDVAAKGGVLTVSVGGEGDYVVKGGAVWKGGKKLLEIDFPHLKGPHNAQNVASALALLVPRWVTLEQFVAGAASFMGLPHRLENVGMVDGVAFVNDSKATNGDSAVYALQSFSNIYWICGGDPKSDGLGDTVHHLEHVRAAFTIGASGDDFAGELERRGVPVFRCGVLEKAVAEAFASARTEGMEGAVVLLSPAAASLDQFKSFEHRGDVFVNCVRQLGSHESGARDEAARKNIPEVNA